MEWRQRIQFAEHRPSELCPFALTSPSEARDWQVSKGYLRCHHSEGGGPMATGRGAEPRGHSTPSGTAPSPTPSIPQHFWETVSYASFLLSFFLGIGKHLCLEKWRSALRSSSSRYTGSTGQALYSGGHLPVCPGA